MVRNVVPPHGNRKGGILVTARSLMSRSRSSDFKTSATCRPLYSRPITGVRSPLEYESSEPEYSNGCEMRGRDSSWPPRRVVDADGFTTAGIMYGLALLSRSVGYQGTVYTRNVNVQGGYPAILYPGRQSISISGQMEIDTWHNDAITDPRRIFHIKMIRLNFMPATPAPWPLWKRCCTRRGVGENLGGQLVYPVEDGFPSALANEGRPVLDLLDTKVRHVSLPGNLEKEAYGHWQ